MSNTPPVSRRSWLGQLGGATLALAGTQLTRNSAMSEDAKRPLIVDPHVHVWVNDPRYPWPADLASPPKADATPEMLLAEMKRHGVDRTVIVHVIYYRWDCRYAADSVRAHPGQVRRRLPGRSRKCRGHVAARTLGFPGPARRAVEPRLGTERRVDQRRAANGRDLEPCGPAQSADVRAVPDRADSGRREGHRPARRPARRLHRPHGRLPDRPARRAQEAAGAGPLSAGVRQAEPPVVAIEARIPLSRHARPGAAAVRCFRTPSG